MAFLGRRTTGGLAQVQLQIDYELVNRKTFQPISQLFHLVFKIHVSFSLS